MREYLPSPLHTKLNILHSTCKFALKFCKSGLNVQALVFLLRKQFHWPAKQHCNYNYQLLLHSYSLTNEKNIFSFLFLILFSLFLFPCKKGFDTWTSKETKILFHNIVLIQKAIMIGDMLNFPNKAHLSKIDKKRCFKFIMKCLSTYKDDVLLECYSFEISFEFWKRYLIEKRQKACLFYIDNRCH